MAQEHWVQEKDHQECSRPHGEGNTRGHEHLCQRNQGSCEGQENCGQWIEPWLSSEAAQVTFMDVEFWLWRTTPKGVYYFDILWRSVSACMVWLWMAPSRSHLWVGKVTSTMTRRLFFCTSKPGLTQLLQRPKLACWGWTSNIYLYEMSS